MALWLVAGLAISPRPVPAEGNAQAQLGNDSIHVYPGDCSCGFGLTWTISFSSAFTEDPAFANGEIAPLSQPAAYSHWSYLVLEDPSLYASATYAAFDLPLGTDANGNGTADFLKCRSRSPRKARRFTR